MNNKEFVERYGLNVEGSLYLRGTQITSLPDNLTVGGGLDLSGTQITSLPDNLTVGGYLYLRGTQITALPDNLAVGGYLDLRGTQITALPDNLTVGGSLYLRGTQITSLPDNLTVGGYLDLRGTQITALPDNLTVGGGLDLEGTQITSRDAEKIRSKPFPEGLILSWQDGKYISADGIFSEVVSHKGNVYRTRKIGKERVEYLVTDSKGKWAHGATLEAARADLVYKIGSRDKSQYAALTMDSVLPFEKAIEAYRVITGACSAGTRGFVEQLAEVKEQYSIREICELTKGKFGNSDFCDYFANK